MLGRFQENLESTGLIPSGARVLVGYSGGADSTCLLTLLVESGFDVVAAHLDHSQRPEGADESQRCGAYAESLGVTFMAGKADVPALSRDLSMGIEEAGRKARYQFFESAKRSCRADLIATAHTRDDHFETVLMNLCRGTGLTGLVGIPATRRDIVRPLLSFSREETRGYCADRGLWFHDDPANDDPAYTRSFFRHSIVPGLLDRYPGAPAAALRMSKLVDAELEFLNGVAAAHLEGAAVRLNGHLEFLTLDCEVGLDRGRLLAAPPIVVARGLRLVVSALGGELDSDQTEGLLSAISAGEGSRTATGGSVVAEWSLDKVHIRQLKPTVPGRVALPRSGDLTSAEFGWRFLIGEPVKSALDYPPNLSETLDPGCIKWPLHARPAAVGESISPLGMHGTKKLSDLYQSHGLTEAARKRLPLVCDMVGPVWVPGICIADRAKMTEHSKCGLRLALEPATGPKA